MVRIRIQNNSETLPLHLSLSQAAPDPPPPLRVPKQGQAEWYYFAKKGQFPMHHRRNCLAHKIRRKEKWDLVIL